MMQLVYKYRLEWHPVQIVKLPLKRVLTVQLQDGKPCLWALVDPATPDISLTVQVVGTGTRDDCDFDKLRYISTTQYGAFVLHWFIENSPNAPLMANKTRTVNAEHKTKGDSNNESQKTEAE